MRFNEPLTLKLYKYENSRFILQAIIDDYQEISFERNLYQAGTFTITINYNIPNSQLFQRGLFVQFGIDPYDFGEIITINDSIGADGKGSQTRTITGYDARYILKRRVIKNMNSNGLWVMTAKGELCLRNLIKDQCGSNAESKRQLPIINVIPEVENAIGKEYSVTEQFTNLYEACKTIATQSEIGWRLAFDGTSLTLECYEGSDKSQTVQFSTSFDSLANGEFSDSSESYSNAIYVGGKGQNDNRDIYEGENGTPSGLERFESWDNQSQMTTESEYKAEALSMLTQYGQTIQMSGNGLAKCPYIYKEQYNVGDFITVAFSGKSAIVQILSVTEHWAWGSYDIQFSFGKPQNNLAEQLQLMLRKIQSASNKESSTDSVRWYTIPTETEMPKADVTYNTIGFIGNCAVGGSTFTLYLDNEKTGAKTYHVYFKQLGGGNLTLTTGKEGATDLVMNSGTYVAIIYVDENGNITMAGATATSTIEAGNNLPATSEGVYQAIQSSAIDVSRVGAYCTTAGSVADKVASMQGYTLTGGNTFPITFDEENTASSALTLNIAGTGAKTIYINGGVSSASNHTLKAGTYMCRYNGTDYYIDTAYGVISARQANTASKLIATSYENDVSINWRAGNSNYHTTTSYQTSGNEALVFATKNDVTSFMFVNGEDSVANHYADRWQSLTPALQIKKGCVSIGKLIGSGTNPAYKLEVDGIIKSSGIADSSNGSATTFAYSKTGLSSVTWLAGWNSYELRAVSPAVAITTQSALNSDNGYMVFPNGLKIRWGYLTFSAFSKGSTITLSSGTLSPAFSSNTYKLVTTIATTEAGGEQYITAKSASSFTVKIYNRNSGTTIPAGSLYYLAIGY